LFSKLCEVQCIVDQVVTTTQSSAVENSAASPASSLSFEEAMRELDAIVAQMEDGTLTLEESLAAYKRGAELVKCCQTVLESVREQVQVLDGEILKPLADVIDRM
jgi:exodeoxyribonuclease VII small subunit